MTSEHKRSFETVVAWASDELDPTSAAALERDARDEPALARQMERVRRLLGDITEGDAVHRIVQRARSIAGVGTPVESFARWRAAAGAELARLVSASVPGAAARGVRGGEAEARQLEYECEDGRVELRITPARTDHLWTIRGRVRAVGPAAETATLMLATDHAPVASCLVDDAGRFRLDAARGTHELLVARESGAKPIVLPTLSLGAAS